ncbi:hypothetical protein CROQUDRAFT_662606 [Cronartium quercuum f. sp. fusiforme G11]|uniref:Uncharacterized protein n=1 Tax=Cronartium quercuum f. sp. fusiforme G11 TaxID=708437 RepID=A0A9P6NDV9_9BASI|nr:hypothetical protein CROQUDRAFT_662606 [Cronartium quercuum f. sp. fusiforme G11]
MLPNHHSRNSNSENHQARIFAHPYLQSQAQSATPKPFDSDWTHINQLITPVKEFQHQSKHLDVCIRTHLLKALLRILMLFVGDDFLEVIKDKSDGM